MWWLGIWMAMAPRISLLQWPTKTLSPFCSTNSNKLVWKICYIEMWRILFIEMMLCCEKYSIYWMMWKIYYLLKCCEKNIIHWKKILFIEMKKYYFIEICEKYVVFIEILWCFKFVNLVCFNIWTFVNIFLFKFVTSVRLKSWNFYYILKIICLIC